MMDETGSINLSLWSGRPRTGRTNTNIKIVKQKLQRQKAMTRKVALELGISQKSAHKFLRNDLGCQIHKNVIKPALTEEHKKKEKVR